MPSRAVLKIFLSLRRISCGLKLSSVKNLGDTLLTILVLGGILVVSAVLTNWFTRAMYYRCKPCNALNAKRRTHCRVCGTALASEES